MKEFEVLLIEDNPGDARLIQEYFKEVEKNAIHVHWVDSLKKGIEEFHKEDTSYELILLDLSLPDSQGIKTVKALRSSVDSVPIIVLTGLNDELTAIQSVISGAQDYLVKNEITPGILNRTIRYSIERFNLMLKIVESHKRYKRVSMQLQTILENIGDGVIAVDPDGKVIFINRMAEDMIITKEKSRKECIDQPITDCIKIQDQHMKNLFDGLFNSCAESDQFNAACRNILLKNGNNILKYINIRCSPILKQNLDEHDGFVFIFEDITESVKLREEILKSQKLDSVGFLASGIAHDFNNLLMTVLGNIFIAKKRFDLNPELLDMANDIENAITDAKYLTKQLLQFTKQHDREKPEVLDTSKLVKEYVDFSLRGTNLTPVYKFGENIWNIEMDRTNFSQIINNLVINAVQATPQGGNLVIGIKNTQIGKSTTLPLETGDYVEITITDEGCGIPDHIINKIFEPYFTTKEKGTGLGLATSFSIVRNNGGHLTVTSQDGNGSTFYIYLPRSRQSCLHEKQQELIISKSEKRVLVMDDEASIRQILNQMLSSIGYKVTVTADGEEMISKFLESQNSGNKFDLLIVDHTVKGGLGGIETIARIREIDPDVTAVISSGHYKGKFQEQFKEIGFNATLPKPYTMEELVGLLNKIDKKGNSPS